MVFPGLKLKALFGADASGEVIVNEVEYDFSRERLEAWVDFDRELVRPFEESDSTFAEDKARGVFLNWDTSDFEDP